MSEHEVQSDLLQLPGIVKKTAQQLARLNIYTLTDLLFHFPLRYEDRTTLLSLAQLSAHMQGVVEGVIKRVYIPRQGKTRLLCELDDGTGKLLLRFFHLVPFQLKLLKPQNRLQCYGAVQRGHAGWEMIHPEFKILNSLKTEIQEKHLTAIYPTTEGLSQYSLRKITDSALNWFKAAPDYEEILPIDLWQNLKLPSFKSAVCFIHRPPSTVSSEELAHFQTAAQQRLIFEELLVYRLTLLHLKKMTKRQKGFPQQSSQSLIPRFLAILPFQLTNAQKRVQKEIEADLLVDAPMLRLVQGDVGSGKTVIAALSMLQVIESGYQVALMAPTELLAEQHYRVFLHWFSPLNLQVVLLKGGMKKRERTAIYEAIKLGQAPVVIGTHALFQEQLQFKKLALIVIDEQHRFGVEQRALFRDKGVQQNYYPHQLLMTATPIPRTLAMSMYADLDLSMIDELPPSRVPIQTSLVMSNRRNDVIDRVHAACLEGRQVYWVCPLIDENENMTVESAIKMARDLTKVLPKIKVGFIHGKMKSVEKDFVMQAFIRCELQILVATTVIEVGVDVPNASVMVIENAERLGLAQLHQLRGRVGRGVLSSHCVLLYQTPLSPMAKERLMVMKETTDGFLIAEKDLTLRGGGEVLGTRQTGAFAFRVADLLRDRDFLPQVLDVATYINQKYPHLIEGLMQRWARVDLGYAKV